MNYDFDKIIARRGTNSVKWEVAAEELPMWVADMDFETAPEIRAAIVKRAELKLVGDLCAKYYVTVVSDEIH